jgi:predicted NUDIX family phosphoesterase
MSSNDEQVLVVARSVLDAVGPFQGLTFDVDRYLDRFFSPGVGRFISRAAAETDPAHKQLIPYVVMTSGDRVLSYVRGKRGGETRLIGRRSIGIGGHVNPVDDLPLLSGDLRETYRAAVEREVAEEVNVETSHTDRVVALLNDDSTEVGRVHLGIVHLWRLDAPAVTRREQMITRLEFLRPAELHAARDTLESWSQLCLDHLAGFDGESDDC